MDKEKSTSLILAGILKRLGNYNMKTFTNRLLFQKTVYFLQIFGLNFGYIFNWYVYGPYSPQLTKSGYETDKLRNVQEVEFIDPIFEQKLDKLNKFLGERKNNTDWLELLASIHFLKTTSILRTKSQIIETITNKQTHFSKQDCEKAFEYLKRHEL